MKKPVAVVLLHSPMVDRAGKEVTTAVTNLDIHDIARTCRTYGVTRYFIVNPEVEQERLVKNILGHWKDEVARLHHPSRAEALSLVSFVRTFEEAYNEVAAGLTGSDQAGVPYVAMPDARDLRAHEKLWSTAGSYEELRSRWEGGRLDERPLMIVFGTGWGIAPSFFGQVDQLLLPIRKTGLGEAERGYNHLSVRAAAAIVLDRLFGSR